MDERQQDGALASVPCPSRALSLSHVIQLWLLCFVKAKNDEALCLRASESAVCFNKSKYRLQQQCL